jgi:hypothetical protein
VPATGDGQPRRPQGGGKTIKQSNEQHKILSLTWITTVSVSRRQSILMAYLIDQIYRPGLTSRSSISAHHQNINIMPFNILSLPNNAAAHADLGAETLLFIEDFPLWQRIPLLILVVIAIVVINVDFVCTAWLVILFCLWKRARDYIAFPWQVGMVLILAFS